MIVVINVNVHNEVHIQYVACVNHLRRPPVHVGWSLVRVSLKWQQGSERKRSQEVEKGGEAGGAPPSPAAGDTHTHTQQG